MAIFQWILHRIGDEDDTDFTDLEYMLNAPVQEEEKSFMVGRGRNNTIVLGSLFVSRRHCEFIVFHGGELYINDLGTENGTYLNNVKITSGTREQLNPGDKIGLGTTEYEDSRSYLFEIQRRYIQHNTPSIESNGQHDLEGEVAIEVAVDDNETEELSRKSLKRSREEVLEGSNCAKVQRIEQQGDIVPKEEIKVLAGPEIVDLSSDDDEIPAPTSVPVHVPVSKSEVLEAKVEQDSPESIPCSSTSHNSEHKSEAIPSPSKTYDLQNCLEPIPGTCSSNSYNPVTTIDNGAKMKDEDQENEAFLNDLVENNETRANSSVEPNSYVIDDDVIFVDEVESYWQPSQLFSDTQVGRIKQELDEALVACKEEDESEGSDVENHVNDCDDDQEIIEISDDDDDDDSINMWYSRLSQAEIKSELQEIQKGITSEDDKLLSEEEEECNNEEMLGVNEDDNLSVHSPEDIQVDVLNKVPAEDDGSSITPQESPAESSDHLDSDDSDILPRKVAGVKSRNRSRPIISDSDDSDTDSDFLPPQSSRLKPPVLNVVSPIKVSNLKEKSASPPTLSPQKPLRQSSASFTSSETEDEVDMGLPSTSVAVRKGAEDNEVEEKSKKTGKNNVPRKPHLIDALPMPYRRSNLRGISAETAHALFQQNTEKKRLEDLEKQKDLERALDEERRSQAKANEMREKGMDQLRDAEALFEEHEMPVKIGKKRVSALGDKTLTRQKIMPVVSKTTRRKQREASPDNKPDNNKSERLERLKRIAEKEKDEREAKEHEASLCAKQKRPAGNVVMKITTTNRGAKLAEEIEKNAPQTKQSTSAPVLPPISSLGRIPKKPSSTVVQEPASSATATSSNSLPPVPSTSQLQRRVSTGCATQPVPDSYIPHFKRRSSHHIETLPVIRLKSCIRQISDKKRIKKSVRFRHGGPEIRRFEVEGNASLNSVGRSKDSSVPRHPREVLQQNHDHHLENIHDICRWTPLWLSEQKGKKTTPPVAGNLPPIPMLPRFLCYEDYVKVVRPLMLLELWASIVSKYEPNNPQKQLHFAVNRVEPHPVQLKDKAMSRFRCHSLLTHEEGVKNMHPNEGDLVTLELPLETDPVTKRARFIQGQQHWLVNADESPPTQRNTLSLFAYVEYFKKKKYHRNSPTKVHIELLSTVKKPQYIVHMDLVLRARPFVLRITQLMRLNTESYIKPMLRNFKALAHLEHSPLCSSILNPTEAEFYLPPVDTRSYVPTNPKPGPLNYLTFTSHREDLQSFSEEGKLNTLQIEAVLKANGACLANKPKILMIQGPPGTGKSHMIVNLVTKLLAGLGRDKRILLCAPSNAAVDEIVIRLLRIRSSLPRENRFNLVRCGNTKAITSPEVKSITVDYLADNHLKTQNIHGPQQIESVTLQLNTLIAKKAKAYLELESARSNKQNTRLIEQRISHFESNINKLHRGRNENRTFSYEDKETARNYILQKAHIVAVTLNSCMNDVMERAFVTNPGQEMFSCCIVDEASQCSEPETLLPLVHGVKVLVLVGDSMQLPAMTNCRVAKENGFSESMLTRLEKCFFDMPSNPTIMLTDQYRMHPAILRWPNEYFYENQLKSLPGFDRYRSCDLKPYVILHHPFTQENAGVMSNHREAELVCSLVHELNKTLLGPKNMTLGIITPYTRQRDHINRMLGLEGIKVNTIDGFQGQERDIIVISCVRTSGTGFMAEGQRLNVALTRAKFSLIICANFNSLERDPMWRALMNDGIVRNATYRIKKKSMPPPKMIKEMIYKQMG